MPLFQGLGCVLQAFDGLARYFGRFLSGLIGYDSHRLRNRPILPDQEGDDAGAGNSHDSPKKSEKPAQDRGHDSPDDTAADGQTVRQKFRPLRNDQ